MSTNATPSNVRRPQNADPPSIEVTPDSDAEITEEASAITRRGNGRQSKLSPLLTTTGILVTFSHSSMGIVLLVVGCVLKTLIHATPGLTHAPSKMKDDGDSVAVFPTHGLVLSRKNDNAYPPLLFDPRPAALEGQCLHLTCSVHLPLICIGIGTMFVICGITGGLLVLQRLKNYVCCHLAWVSISALCAITFSAACMMDLGAIHESGQSLAACICILIAATLFETLFCVLDLYTVSTGRQNRPSDEIETATESSTRNGSRGSSRMQSRLENTSSGGNRQQTRNAESSLISGSARRNNATSSNENASGSNHNSGHSRTRREGQGTRDRNSLHPNHHQQTRNRTRRRPMLRTQNHYVLVPAAYGRPRVSSRVRRHVSDRRNRIDMPMFVIPNHDRYVQELNRSMETLEMEPNRGSVPSNVLPSAQVNKNETKFIQKSESKAKLPITKQLSETSTTHQSSDEKLSVQGEMTPTSAKSENRLFSVDDTTTTTVNTNTENLDTKRSIRNTAGYSVVRRTKKSSTEQNRSETQPLIKEHNNEYLGSIESQQMVLAQKLGRAASAVEDSVFYNNPPSVIPAFTDHCPPNFERRYPLAGRTPSQMRLYNTSSEGDFSTISTGSSSVVTPSYDRTCHASVSSDSGIIESARGKQKVGRRHYHNLPLLAGRRSLELRDFDHSKRHSALSPVSTATPSYENINVRFQAGSTQRERDEFILATYANRSPSEDLDEYNK